MADILKKQDGSALILALIAMVFLSGIGAAYYMLSTSSLNTAVNERDAIAAQYLAEAGAQWAITQIKADPTYTTSGVTSALSNPGKYTVKVENVSTQKRITSVGTVNKVSRTVILMVTPAASGGNVAYTTASYSMGNMRITAPKVKGDIGSNGTVLFTTSEPETVEGTVYSDSVSYYSSAVAAGYDKSKAATLDVDSMIPNLTMTGTDITTTWAQGQWGNHTYALSSGSYYYNGNYDFNGHSYSIASGQNVTLYVNGTFTLMYGSVFYMNGGTLTIYATGGVNFNGGSISGTDSSVIKIYSVGNVVNLSSNSYIKGQCLIVSLKDINVNGINAPNTDLVSKTNIHGSSGSVVAGVYSAGTIVLDGATVNYSKTTNTAVGLSGTSTPFSVDSFNDHT